MFRFILNFALLVVALGHPQCLDYQPPYEPQSPLTMCSEYQDFSCCNDEDAVRSRYLNILQSLNQNDVDLCNSYIRTILCQACSPYAAHLYFAESTQKPSTFPSLCTDYYNQFYNVCSHLLPLLTNNTTPMAPDPNYCYPEIKNSSTATIDLGQTNIAGTCTQLCVKEVINDLFSPTSAKHAGDGTHRMFVLEQRGVVWIYLANFTKLSPSFIDIRRETYESGRRFDERGLLDIAFHPNFKENRKFYLFYSFRRGTTHVSRTSEFTVSPTDMNRADKSSERVIIDVPQSRSNHNGGSILFREGLLYIFTGDGGGANDPDGNGQNKATLLAKALRINVDNYTTQPYSIPPDNPFVGEPNVSAEIYAYGLRNPWRCTLDRGDAETGEVGGRIFCGDVGQNRFEEIDIIEKGGNYGWNGYEGNSCFRNCRSVVNHTRPINTYGRSFGKSITGGYLYRGCESPNLKGKYIFGDWENSRLYFLEEQNGTWSRRNICLGGTTLCVNGGLSSSYVRYINSFAEDELGEVYILSTSSPESDRKGGHMYQLVDPAKRGNPATCNRTLSTPLVINSSTTLIPFKMPTTAQSSLVFRIHHRSSSARGRYGVVEVRRAGSSEWGTICASNWDTRDANVLCRQLKYRAGFPIRYRSSYGTRRYPYRLTNVNCDGGEGSVSQCRLPRWGQTNCSLGRPATVYCY